MFRGKHLSVLLLLGFILFAGFISQGCVTAGEYDRLKDQLGKANETIDMKDQRIEELDYELMVRQEETLSIQDEVGMFRQHSEEAARIIADLKEQLEDSNRTLSGASGIPGVEIIPIEGEGVGIRLQDYVLFNSGSDTIKSQGKDVLKIIAQQLKVSSNKIKIAGHTDSDPVVKTKAKYPAGNIQLSTARAIAVFKYLAGQGISEKRMSVEGNASNVPLVPNTTTENKQRNRRVEIILKNS